MGAKAMHDQLIMCSRACMAAPGPRRVVQDGTRHSSGSHTVCCCPPAGFGAAKHLSEQGYAVTLLDAAANPGGLSAGWRTAKGRVVEAGMKGFWYQVR